MKILRDAEYEKLRQKHQSEGRIIGIQQGFRAGVDQTLRLLLEQRLVFYPQGESYLDCTKISIDPEDFAEMDALVNELVGRIAQAEFQQRYYDSLRSDLGGSCE